MWSLLKCDYFIVECLCFNVCHPAVHVWCDHEPRRLLQAAGHTRNSTSATVGHAARRWEFPITISRARCPILRQFSTTVGQSRANFPHERSSGRPRWWRQTASDISDMNAKHVFILSVTNYPVMLMFCIKILKPWFVVIFHWLLDPRDMWIAKVSSAAWSVFLLYCSPLTLSFCISMRRPPLSALFYCWVCFQMWSLACRKFCCSNP